MHHESLLTLLKKYHTTDMLEETMKIQMADFVSANSNCFDRSCPEGHITASAWILNPNFDRALLTYHRKLGKWLQLGGHIDQNEDTFEAALREAQEESGLKDFKFVHREIFDIDIHLIPERANEPKHFHFDVRVALTTSDKSPLRITQESKDLKWIQLDHISEYTREESVHRMLRKTASLRT